MTSRERVLAAIHHQLPDQIPVHVMLFSEHAAYCKRLNVENDDELRTALGLDVSYSIGGPEYIGKPIAKGMTVWGTRSHGNNTGYSQSRGGHPLQSAETVQDVERYPWPSVADLDFSVLRTRANEAGDKARMVNYAWEPVFCRVADLFGMEEALIKLHTHPAVIEAAVAHIAEYLLRSPERELPPSPVVQWIFSGMATILRRKGG